VWVGQSFCSEEVVNAVVCCSYFFFIETNQKSSVVVTGFFHRISMPTHTNHRLRHDAHWRGQGSFWTESTPNHLRMAGRRFLVSLKSHCYEPQS